MGIPLTFGLDKLIHETHCTNVIFNSNKIRFSLNYLAPVIDKLNNPNIPFPVKCAFKCKDQGYVNDFNNFIIFDSSYFGSKEFIQLINYNWSIYYKHYKTESNLLIMTIVRL